jgi:hypothetical protein
MTEPASEGTGDYPSSALLGAPVALGRGRQTPDQARDLAGWNSGELPGQVAEQLASWPPAYRRRTSRQPARYAAPQLPRTANPLDKRVHSCVLACCKNHPA